MFDSLSIVKTPAAARKLFAAALWKVRTKEKILYLTFDDGPISLVTPLVLDELKKYNAKATFFCIGKNIAENPQVFKQILEEGHLVANHTQNHLNGWLTENNIYFENIGQCAEMLNTAVADVAAENSNYKSITEGLNYFRPPYGKLSITQYNFIKKLLRVLL
jgi:peptidoglycan-N-acetylglucosamine deacetylase